MFRFKPSLVFAASIFFSMSMTAAHSRQIDRIIAVVNDDVITQSEFQSQLQRIKQDLRARNAQMPPTNVFNRQVLERMVTDKIQLQLAKRLGISVPEDAVDAALRELAARNDLSLAELQRTLAAEGVPYETFRENIKTQLIIRRLVDREVVSRIAVTEDEIDGYVRTQSRQSGGSTEYNLSHILIGVPESAATETISGQRKKAEEVLARIKKGMEFEQAAIAYSQASNALEGGSLGWRTMGQLPELFVESIRNLQSGQVSEVLQSPNGFHILKVNGKRGGAHHTVEQTKVRHILIKSDQFLSPTEAEQRIGRVRRRILAGEDFAELARTLSDDPVSSVNGGDLGWVNPGETVEAFERAMRALPKGALSEPISTPYGVHLIQVLDRREVDVSDTASRNDALNQIRARKSDESYERWVRRLRDEAYVEYKVNEL